MMEKRVYRKRRQQHRERLVSELTKVYTVQRCSDWATWRSAVAEHSTLWPALSTWISDHAPMSNGVFRTLESYKNHIIAPILSNLHRCGIKSRRAGERFHTRLQQRLYRASNLKDVVEIAFGNALYWGARRGVRNAESEADARAFILRALTVLGCLETLLENRYTNRNFVPTSVLLQWAADVHVTVVCETPVGPCVPSSGTDPVTPPRRAALPTCTSVNRRWRKKSEAGGNRVCMRGMRRPDVVLLAGHPKGHCAWVCVVEVKSVTSRARKCSEIRAKYGQVAKSFRYSSSVRPVFSDLNDIFTCQSAMYQACDTTHRLREYLHRSARLALGPRRDVGRPGKPIDLVFQLRFSSYVWVGKAYFPGVAAARAAPPNTARDADRVDEDGFTVVKRKRKMQRNVTDAPSGRARCKRKQVHPSPLEPAGGMIFCSQACGDGSRVSVLRVPVDSAVSSQGDSYRKALMDLVTRASPVP